MKKQDCYYLGKIVSKFSFKGEILLKLDVDEPTALKISTIFIEIEKSLVPFSVNKISLHKSSLLKIKFEGIDNEDSANSILKKETFLPLKELPKLEGNKFYYHEIIGFKAIDIEFGEVGIIERVNDQTRQAIILVKNPKNKVIMIPLVDDFLVELNRKEKRMIFKLPEGLINL